MNFVVIDHISDAITLGINYLKEFNVSLSFTKNRPVKLLFKGIGSLEPVHNLQDIKLNQNQQIPNELPLPKLIKKQIFEPTFENFFENYIPFEKLQNKIFMIKSKKNSFCMPIKLHESVYTLIRPLKTISAI